MPSFEAVRNFPWSIIAPAITFVGGVLAKPLSDHLTKILESRRERARLRNAIYRELGANFKRLVAYHCCRNSRYPTPFGKFPAIQDWEHREVYDAALKTEPILLNELREAHLIKAFYEHIEIIKTLPDDRQDNAIEAIRIWVQRAVGVGELHRSKLNDASRMNHDTFMFPHPLQRLLTRTFLNLTTRNRLPADRYYYPHGAGACVTFSQKVRALWRGQPEDAVEIASEISALLSANQGAGPDRR